MEILDVLLDLLELALRARLRDCHAPTLLSAVGWVVPGSSGRQPSSAEMPPAVSCTAGAIAWASPSDRRSAGLDRLTAASTLPSAPRIGAARQRRPRADSSSSIA